MKILHVAFSAFLFSLTAIIPAHAERSVKTINDNWDFKLHDAKEWNRVSIPHTFNEDAYKTRDYYKGKGVYRRNLFMQSVDPGLRYYLKFDAANKHAEVVFNDSVLSSHPSGYNAFIVDITDCLAAGNNDLVVTVDNSRLDVGPVSADFTFWGGLYRDAWLISVPDIHFDMSDFGSNGVAVNVTDVNTGKARVKVLSGVSNDSSSSTEIILNNTIFDPDGKEVASVDRKVKIPAGKTLNVETEFKEIASPKLWSPSNPYLYKVRTRLLNPKTREEIDAVSNPLGFRWFEFDPEKGFFLNGEHLKLRGVNRHQDKEPLGWALSDEAHRRDFEMIKDMGANFVRLAHYPQDDAVLEQCDKLGLMVWEEIPVVNRVDSTPGFDENCEYGLREMIRQHRNHPSVIGWGYMNEILLRAPGENDSAWAGVRDHTLDLARHLEKIVKDEDQSRVSFTAFHGSDRYNKVGLNIADVTGWNLYQGWYGGDLSGFDRYLENQHKHQPLKPIIVSEWGAGSDRRLHSLKPKPFDFSIEYQQKYVEHYLPYIESHDFVAGGAYWNFIDFNVAERQESMPRVNNKGLLYNNRDWKDVAYYFKAAWRDDIPVLHIATRDWNERISCRGEKMPVKIYGNVDEVELIVNGTSLGRKKLDNFNCIFDVEFLEGVSNLIARATKDNVDVEDVAVVRISGCPDITVGETLAVNVGSNCYFTSEADNFTWIPDRAYSPGGWGYVDGEAHSTTSEIFGTADGPVFQTSRVGMSEYRIDAPSGDYELELLMADINRPSALSPYLLGRGETADVQGLSRMDIEINGNMVETSFSPSDGDNYFQPVRKRYIIHNVDDAIVVKFIPKNGTPSLSGITLRRL